MATAKKGNILLFKFPFGEVEEFKNPSVEAAFERHICHFGHHQEGCGTAGFWVSGYAGTHRSPRSTPQGMAPKSSLLPCVPKSVPAPSSCASRKPKGGKEGENWSALCILL